MLAFQATLFIISVLYLHLGAQTQIPSEIPTTEYPTTDPSLSPSGAPTATPTATTESPTNTPSSAPSSAPTSSPTINPTSAPSHAPTPAPTPQSTLIEDVWNDDFIFNGVDDFGWSLDETVLNNQTHGPYFAGTYWLLRWFQCSTYSTVSIEYKFLCCSDNDHGDIAVYINGDQVDLQNSYKFPTSSNRTDYPYYSGCANYWRELIVSDIGAVVMTKHESFYVELRMHSLHGNDGVALSYIKVTCGPAISDSPTEEPTEPTMIPTSDPTANPTQPTVDPTAAPTESTINPTSAPTSTPTATSVSPTSAPSRSPSSAPTSPPTRNPSLATDAPSSAPSATATVDPTTAPTFGPTNKPIFGPINNQSFAPANRPSIGPEQLLSTNDLSEPLTSIDDANNIHSVSSDLSITTLTLIGVGFGALVFIIICCVFATIGIIKKCDNSKSNMRTLENNVENNMMPDDEVTHVQETGETGIELEQDRETEPGYMSDSEPSLPSSERNHGATQQITAEVSSDSDDDDDNEDSSELLYTSVNDKAKSTAGGTNLHDGEDDDADNEELMSEASSFSINKRTKPRKGRTVEIEFVPSPVTVRLPDIHTKEGFM